MILNRLPITTSKEDIFHEIFVVSCESECHQIFFLLFSGASFAEHFYGLKRYVDEGSQSKVLPRRARWKSLILLWCYYLFTHTHISLHHRKNGILFLEIYQLLVQIQIGNFKFC